jgi:aminocarboxymuconate-semialdehyde decarboxylase
MCGDINGVDVHGHGVPIEFLEAVRKSGLAKVKVEVEDKKYTVTFPGKKALRPMAGVMLQFEERMEWLDSQGMQHQLMAPWLDVEGQDLPAADGEVWVRELNNALAEAVARSKGRLIAYASVHLADPKVAARELERAKRELKLPGCMLPAQFPGGNFGEARYDALWEAAQALRMPIVLHPATVGISGCMFGDLPEFKGVFGRTIDTTIAAAQMISTGVFERHPKMDMVLVHGGGMLPYQSMRYDREFKGNIKPSDLMKRFYYDTTLMSPSSLKLLFSLAGTSQVVIGSDYGAQVKERPAPKLTWALDETGVTAAQRKQVVRDNAVSLFNILTKA